MSVNYYPRYRTIALLLRFYRMALLAGRMPSLLGREVIPSANDGPPRAAFENTIVFVCDVERCLDKLSSLARRLVAACVFEGVNEWDVARRTGMHVSAVSARLGAALDFLHDEFCRCGLLPPVQEDLLRQINPQPQGEQHEQT